VIADPTAYDVRYLQTVTGIAVVSMVYLHFKPKSELFYQRVTNTQLPRPIAASDTFAVGMHLATELPEKKTNKTA